MLRILCAALLTAASVVAMAQTRYITDELRVPLRNSPCDTCTIVHPGLTPGTSLTLVDRENTWARVTTRDGASGWLPELYLATEPVAQGHLAALDASNNTLKAENSKLKNQLTEITAAYDELEQQYATDNETLSTIEVELSSVRKMSNNALALQEQNEELIKRNRMLQSEIDVLTASRDQLQSDSTQRWFIYGGLAVFLGALLAVLLPRLKPRRRYSGWG